MYINMSTNMNLCIAHDRAKRFYRLVGFDFIVLFR